MVKRNKSLEMIRFFMLLQHIFLCRETSSCYRISRAPFTCLSMMEVGCTTNLLY